MNKPHHQFAREVRLLSISKSRRDSHLQFFMATSPQKKASELISQLLKAASADSYSSASPGLLVLCV